MAIERIPVEHGIGGLSSIW